MTCFVRMIGHGYRWDMEVKGKGPGDLLGELFDPELMNGATVLLDAKYMKPQPGREYLDANELLKDRRVAK